MCLFHIDGGGLLLHGEFQQFGKLHQWTTRKKVNRFLSTLRTVSMFANLQHLGRLLVFRMALNHPQPTSWRDPLFSSATCSGRVVQEASPDCLLRWQIADLACWGIDTPSGGSCFLCFSTFDHSLNSREPHTWI